jgi:hypothetical protein
VPAPTELGDWTPHRITDRDELLDPERVGHRDDIVRAILQSKPTRADSSAVAAVIDRNDMVSLGEVGKSGEPIQRARCPKAVEQHQRGSSLRTLELDNPDTTPAFQLQKAFFSARSSIHSGPGLTCLRFSRHGFTACVPHPPNASRASGGLMRTTR